MDPAVLPHHVERSGGRIDATLLEHQSDPASQCPSVTSRSGGVQPEHPNLTRRASSQTFADFDGARLAGPVRAEHGRHLTSTRGERHPVDRGDRPITASVAHGEVVDFDHVVVRTGHDPCAECSYRSAVGHSTQASAGETSRVRPHG